MANRYQKYSRPTRLLYLSTTIAQLLRLKNQSRHSIGSHTNIATISIHNINRQKITKDAQEPKNFEAFRTQIDENLLINAPLKIAKNLEGAIAEFTNIIQKASWGATPEDKALTI